MAIGIALSVMVMAAQLNNIESNSRSDAREAAAAEMIYAAQADRIALTNQKSVLLTFLYDGGPVTRAAYLAQPPPVLESGAQLARAAAVLSIPSAAVHNLLSERSGWEDWALSAAQAELATPGRPSPLAPEANPRFARYLAAADQFGLDLQQAMRRSVAAGTRNDRLSAELALGGGGLVILTLCGLGALFVLRLAVPVRSLADTARKMRTSSAISVPFTAQSDEVGQLARALAEWRGAELARHRSQAQFAAIVATASIGIIQLTREGRVLEANPAAVRLLGRELSELTDRLPVAVPEAAVAVAEAFAAIVRGPAADSEAELEVVRPDGTRVELCVHFTAVRTGGVIDFCYALLEDITARSEAALARRESAAQARFLAQVSHELRTPLNAVLGFSELLRNSVYGSLNPRQVRAVANIESGGRQLLAFIDDLLDLSKVRAGKTAAASAPVALEAVARDGIARLEPMAAGKSISLKLVPGPAVSVLGDPALVTAITTNLLSNAVKYTREGGSVELACGRSEGTGWLSVRDTGVGIPGDHLDSIFDEFSRVSSTYTNGQQGTGLGLSLVKSYVELMGGTVRVESVVEEGSRFTVSLPLAPG